MIVEKLKMPYILASGHGMFHLACIFSNIVFMIFSYANDDVTFDPIQDSGFTLMLIAHGICLLISILIKMTSILQAVTKDPNVAFAYVFFQKFLVLAKMILYFSAITKVQC